MRDGPATLIARGAWLRYLGAPFLEVAKLRAQGETEHAAGKHSESMKSLGEAKKLLGI
jgi:hypothetical protein